MRRRVSLASSIFIKSRMSISSSDMQIRSCSSRARRCCSRFFASSASLMSLASSAALARCALSHAIRSMILRRSACVCMTRSRRSSASRCRRASSSLRALSSAAFLLASVFCRSSSSRSRLSCSMRSRSSSELSRPHPFAYPCGYISRKPSCSASDPSVRRYSPSSSSLSLSLSSCSAFIMYTVRWSSQPMATLLRRSRSRSSASRRRRDASES
mmetsp:Transcript_23525/g.73808  ORF Transcript_23525/g.73808 Transcript_23525/m.73808 type:complete len:214 (+) Transcript_23525:879-1520(+)